MARNDLPVTHDIFRRFKCFQQGSGTTTVCVSVVYTALGSLYKSSFGTRSNLSLRPLV